MAGSVSWGMVVQVSIQWPVGGLGVRIGASREDMDHGCGRVKAWMKGKERERKMRSWESMAIERNLGIGSQDAYMSAL